jgi:hypothetical protein
MYAFKVAFLVALILFFSARAIADYWTAEFSEENPPHTCELGDLIGGLRCAGSHCDNMQLYCVELGLYVSERKWTEFYSEENSQWHDCPFGFITGMSCKGKRCDNISLECSSLWPSYEVDWGRCKVDGPISEEEGVIDFRNWYPVGVWCDGSYCDDKWFYSCAFRPRSR